MATNELAAILARRRAKEGGADAAPAFESGASSASDANGAASPSAPAPAQCSSIAERIARLKQQSAATGPAPMPVPIATARPSYASASTSETPPAPAAPAPGPAPGPWAESTTSWSNSTSGESTTGTTPAESPVADVSAPGNRRTSGRIAQLQGSLGINVNPFRAGGPPGGFRKPSSGHRVEGDGSDGTERAIMTTGDQYAHMHGTMGIRMPGMGAAVPMPGLAKAGTRIPSMTSSAETADEEEAAASASLEASHATMSRVTGPKRRGPTRPPPGAFRLPGAAVPIASPDMPAEVVATESPTVTPAPTVPAATSELFGTAAPTPVVPAATTGLFGTAAPTPIVPVAPSGLFGTASPATETPSAHAFGSTGAPEAYSGPHALPQASPVFEVAKPAATLLQPAPTPVLFSSEPSVVASLSTLRVSDTSTPSTAATPTFSSSSLFGDTAPSFRAPVLAATTVVPPATTPEPVAAPSTVAPPVRKASLFGSASVIDDDDSDSDWSDNESTKSKPQGSLFGVPSPGPTPTVSAPPTATMAPTTSSVVQTSGGLFGGADEHDSLFGGPPSAPASVTASTSTITPASAPAPSYSVAQAPAPTPISDPTPVAQSTSSSSLFGPPAGAGIGAGAGAGAATGAAAAVAAPIRPPQQYSSLFGPDDDENDESDDEGGLFGTGLPTSR